MSVHDLIVNLQNKGYSVTYRKRTDGSYLITHINGEKFTGAKGNTKARQIIGVKLSSKRRKQLLLNVRTKIKKKKLSKELTKEIRKTQRKWKKTKAKGKITTKKVRFKTAEEGVKKVKKYLKKMQKYAEGYAYTENVDNLIAYIRERVLLQYPNEEAKINSVINLLKKKKSVFREKWIERIYSATYDLARKIISVDTWKDNIKTIISKED